MIGVDRHIAAAYMVLGKDLNPHGTLFAGQAVSYMIECGFLAVQSFLHSSHIVCLGVDGLRFLRPVHKENTIQLDSLIVYAGTASVGVYVQLLIAGGGRQAAEGFVSFVCIDEQTGQSRPHGMILTSLSGNEKKLQDMYMTYKGMTR